METNNSNNSSQLETLNPNAFGFPRHRRRPLKSQTYDTFIHLLSLCRDASFSSHFSQDGSGSDTAGQIHDICPERSLNSLNDQVLVDNSRKQVGDSSDMQVEVSCIEDTNILREGNEGLAMAGSNVNSSDSVEGEDKADNKVVDIISDQAVVDNGSKQVRDLSHMQVKVSCRDDTSTLQEGNPEFARAEDNANSSDSVAGENKADDKTVEIGNDHNDKENKASDQFVEIVDDRSDGQFSVDFCDDEGKCPTRDQLKGDEEIRAREVCDSIEFALCMDSVPGLSRSGQDSLKKADIIDSNLTEEMEQELQRREVELEELISVPVHMDSSQFVAAVGNTEEGEIPTGDGVNDESVDILFDDVMLPREKGTEEMLACVDVSDKEKVDCVNGSNEVGKCNSSTSLMLIEKDKESRRENQARRFDNLATGKDLESRKAKVYDSFLFQTKEKMKPVGRHAEAGREHLAPPGKVSARSATKTRSSATTLQDAGASKNKRKRGPQTTEKKEMKKRKERIKRAENNRKLGVKRLKLQPVVKQKTVTYCRHYLKGRCQEGEKCKFSHDTIPLTKSKPCSHFARNSCMKGDDCPFDHQLSKYPCDNYLTKGLCNRGAGCLFSHKMPANDGSLTTSTVLESGSKSPSMLPESKKMDTNQNDVTKYFSMGTPVGKSTEHNVARSVLKHTAHVPRGVNILLHGKSSPSENGKQKQAGQPSISDDIKLDLGKVQSGTDNSNKVNSVPERAATRTPKGINFLSFGKASLENSSGSAVSSLFPNRESGVQLSTLSRSKETPSSPKSDDSVKVASLCGQIPVSSEYSSDVQSSCSRSNEGKSALTHRFVSSGLPDKSAGENSIGIGSSSKNLFLLNSPSSVQRALQSTLSFAAKFESEIKLGSSSSSQSLGNVLTKKKESLGNKSVKGLTVMDFLYGDSNKTIT